MHCKEKFVGQGIKKARMHPKGGEPGHTCAHGWSSHILIPSRPFGYDQV